MSGEEQIAKFPHETLENGYLLATFSPKKTTQQKNTRATTNLHKSRIFRRELREEIQTRIGFNTLKKIIRVPSKSFTTLF